MDIFIRYYKIIGHSKTQRFNQILLIFFRNDLKENKLITINRCLWEFPGLGRLYCGTSGYQAMNGKSRNNFKFP